MIQNLMLVGFNLLVVQELQTNNQSALDCNNALIQDLTLHLRGLLSTQGTATFHAEATESFELFRGEKAAAETRQFFETEYNNVTMEWSRSETASIYKLSMPHSDPFRILFFDGRVSLEYFPYQGRASRTLDMVSINDLTPEVYLLRFDGRDFALNLQRATVAEGAPTSQDPSRISIPDPRGVTMCTVWFRGGTERCIEKLVYGSCDSKIDLQLPPSEYRFSDFIRVGTERFPSRCDFLWYPAPRGHVADEAHRTVPSVRKTMTLSGLMAHSGSVPGPILAPGTVITDTTNPSLTKVYSMGFLTTNGIYLSLKRAWPSFASKEDATMFGSLDESVTPETVRAWDQAEQGTREENASVLGDAMCGAYCLASAALLNRRSMTVEDVCSQHLIAKDGLSIRDICSLASRFKMQSLAVRATLGQIIEWKKCAVLAVKATDQSTSPDHYVLCIGSIKDRLILFDPPREPVIADSAWLKKRWNGEAILISSASLSGALDSSAWRVASIVGICGIGLLVFLGIKRRK